MSTRRVLSTALPALLCAGAIAPASALATCASIPLGDQVTGSQVIATAEFLPGATNDAGVLLSPAKAHVQSYDQGSGPADLDVVTAPGARVFGAEGIAPKPGEVWRLYGSLSSNGALGTSICSGSIVMPATAPTVSVTAGAASKAPVAASTNGKPHSGALPALKLPKSGKLTVKATSAAGAAPGARAAAVRLIAPGHPAKTLKVSWSGSAASLTGRISKLTLGKKGATLVVVTREASFALALRR